MIENNNNEMYQLDHRITELLKNKNATQVSDIYYKLIKGKISIIRDKYPLTYENTTKRLYNNYYSSRMLYFKTCRLWFRLPSFLKEATKFIVDWLYRRAAIANYRFYSHIKNTLDCKNFISIIYTVEILKWKKAIKELIKDTENNEELVFQN